MGNNRNSEVDFFETTHRYFLKKNGRELYAASKIIEVAGASSMARVPFEQKERAGWTGDCVHEIARLHGLGKLNTDNLDPLLTGYFESILKFYKRVKVVLFIESIIFDEALGYAGTVDIVYQDWKNRVCLDDFKTGEILPAFKLQMALYKNAFEKLYKLPVDERATVRLNQDGSFDEKKDRVIYRDMQDYHDARTALAMAFWKIKNNVD